MDIRIKSWLEDIKQSIDEIYVFLPKERDFSAFKKDLKTKKAIERNIEIIGEAINRIIKHNDCNFEITNAQRIVGTRNRIAHEYDNISDEVIWTIILRELPLLEKEIHSLLNE